jgi:myo-inositol catabolism protein IolC
MPLGYHEKLYILAFDHRGSFEKDMFGLTSAPTAEDVERIAEAKRVIFEGMLQAVERGAVAGATGVLVDEQFGSDIPERARAAGLKLAMPVEKSGQHEFDFEYGDDFAAHILKFDPDFSKVLVRFNPEDDPELNERQLERLKRLADWLHANGRVFLFELLVPATDAQLASVGGDSNRYDDELRPELMRRAISAIQDYGAEIDIWKIEGVDAPADAEMLARQARHGAGRDGVRCIVLGRGAATDKVEQWLRVAAPVDGYIGFAIGRSIWWDAVKGHIDQTLQRSESVSMIADNYLHFVSVYEDAAG